MPSHHRSRGSARSASKRVTITLNSSLYPPSVLRGAAAAFLDRAAVVVSRGPRGKVTVGLTAKGEPAPQDLGRLADEFLNEALNQLVRGLMPGGAAADLIYTRAMLSAMGEQNAASVTLDDASLAEAAELLNEARKERAAPRR